MKNLSIALALIYFVYATVINAATPITVISGDATVDGNAGEWNLLTDFVSTLNNAGNPDKTVFGSAYMRYDCEAQRLYIMVSGDNFIQDAAAVWATVDGGPKKQYTGADTPPAFAWTATGYEASFVIAPGTYTIQVHIENDTPSVGHQTAALPGGSPTTGLAFRLACDEVEATDTPTATNTATDTPTDTPTATDTAIVTDTATATPTNTDTPTSTGTPTNEPTATTTPTLTSTVELTPTATLTPTMDPGTSTPTATDTLIPTPTDIPTDLPAATPTPTTDPKDPATAIPAQDATFTPTATATKTPPAPTATQEPNAMPTTAAPLQRHVWLPYVGR